MNILIVIFFLNSLSGKLLISFSLELFNMRILSCSFFFKNLFLCPLILLAWHTVFVSLNSGIGYFCWSRRLVLLQARLFPDGQEAVSLAGGPGLFCLPQELLCWQDGGGGALEVEGLQLESAWLVCPWMRGCRLGGAAGAAWTLGVPGGVEGWLQHGRFAVGCSVLQVGASQFTLEP